MIALNNTLRVLTNSAIMTVAGRRRFKPQPQNNLTNAGATLSKQAHPLSSQNVKLLQGSLQPGTRINEFPAPIQVSLAPIVTSPSIPSPGIENGKLVQCSLLPGYSVNMTV